MSESPIKKKVLFITNGHGEDQTAVKIIENIPKDIEISVMPLVGEGGAYSNTPVHMEGLLKAMPSGGFSARNLFALPKDIFNGLFSHHLEQYKTLKGMRGHFDLVIGIGDIVPIIAGLITKSPFIFVGVNKSDYYKTFGYSYTPWEKWLLKKYAKRIFTRDLITANNLSKEGIRAVYYGNPLMDGIGGYEEIEKSPGEKIIGFLPGTRKCDIDKNLEDFKKIAEGLAKMGNFRFLVATAGAYCNTPVRGAGIGLISDKFENVIYNSDIIIGLSGTGNEQAAGIGKPVVAFYGRGSQYNKKFADAQKELLGESLSLVTTAIVGTRLIASLQCVTSEILSILQDHARYNYMAETGKERMGKPGAVEKIAKEIVEILK